MTPFMFWSNCRALLGKSYSQVDCIGVVAKALGIRCQGTNWLWRSFKNSSKYRYLSFRDTSLHYLDDGAVVFRIRWDRIPSGYSDKPDCHHVGVYYKGRVIQSNPNTGVYETDFRASDWDAWGRMKQVDYSQEEAEPPAPPTPPASEGDEGTGQEMTDHEMILAIYRKICCID